MDAVLGLLVEELREELANVEAGNITIYTHGRDTSAEWADYRRSTIDKLQTLIEARPAGGG